MDPIQPGPPRLGVSDGLTVSWDFQANFGSFLVLKMSNQSMFNVWFFLWFISNDPIVDHLKSTLSYLDVMSAMFLVKTQVKQNVCTSTYYSKPWVANAAHPVQDKAWRLPEIVTSIWQIFQATWKPGLLLSRKAQMNQSLPNWSIFWLLLLSALNFVVPVSDFKNKKRLVTVVILFEIGKLTKHKTSTPTSKHLWVPHK